jgi:hypothetical protein
MALKSAIAAGIVAVTLAFLPGTAAEAGTNITIGIGTGWGDPCWGYPGHRCGWRPRPHHFHVIPRHRPVYYYDYREPAYHKMSCGRIRNMLEDRGYHRIRARDCQGKHYSFRARKNGHNYFVTVNAYSGAIVGRSR